MYVDGLKHNLISVGELCKVGHHVKFDDKYCYIMTSYRETCLINSKAEGTMYPLYVSLIISKPQLCFLSKVVSEESWLWHRKIAHLNSWYINNLVTGEMVQGLPILKFDNETIFSACECDK